MKAQFFIISSVIMIYVIVLTFQYLTGFSDIRLSSIEEHQELSYIQNIKDSFIQTLNTSNISNNGDMNKMVKDINFTKNFFKQELLKKGIDFDSKFIFFSNGFESNDLSDWSNMSGTPQIVNSTAYDGINSLYSNSVEYVTENLSGVSEVYVRTYVNFNTLPSSTNKHYFMDLYENGSQILSLGLENDSGAYKLIVNSISFSGSWISSGISIGNDEWHYFELYWLENGTNSVLKAWYDGQLKIANQTINSGGKGKSVNQYNFGATNAVGVPPDLYVDCITISSDDVGDKCYPDEQNYFDFSLKTNDMNTETEFPYQEEISPLFDDVLWLKFNEGSGIKAYDSSSYHNYGTYYGETFSDGTFVNNPVRVNGIYGKALQFDGSNKYVSIANNPNIDLMSPFTISAWVYIQSPYGQSTNYRTILSKKTDASTNVKYALFYYNSSSTLQFYINTSLSYTFVYSSPVSIGNWYHVAGVYNGTHIILYVNGSPSTPQSVSGTLLVSTQPLLIGSWNTGATFNGTIDEVRIWNRSLSQAEIQAEMNSSLPTSRPVASYSFEEPSGATYVNDTHIWVNGTYGSALSFDGVNDYVNISNSASLNPKSITLGAWIKPLPTGYNQMIINKWADIYDLFIDSSGHLSFGFRNSSYVINGINSNLQASWNAWQFVAVTYNGTHAVFYLNGTSNVQPFNYGDINTGDTNFVCIGCEAYHVANHDAPSDCAYFNGTIDEARIWNRTLSSSEILNCYQNGC